MTSPTGPSPSPSRPRGGGVRGAPRAPRPSKGAFTLLELIAVLVLISTVLAIAAPSLRGFVHGRKTADAAAELLSLTHLARSRAAARGCIYRLNVDTERGLYGLTVQRGGAFVDLGDAYGRVHEVPKGVTVRLDRAAGADAWVQFYPDGRCDPATIELIGGGGEVLLVTCPCPTERFRVVSPEASSLR